MDLVKARERARQKARQEEKSEGKSDAGTQGEIKTEEPAGAPGGESRPGAGIPTAGEEEKVSSASGTAAPADEKSPAAQEAEKKSRREKEKPLPSRAEASPPSGISSPGDEKEEPEAAPLSPSQGRPPFEPADILFDDTAFGEGLPEVTTGDEFSIGAMLGESTAEPQPPQRAKQAAPSLPRKTAAERQPPSRPEKESRPSSSAPTGPGGKVPPSSPPSQTLPEEIDFEGGAEEKMPHPAPPPPRREEGAKISPSPEAKEKRPPPRQVVVEWEEKPEEERVAPSFADEDFYALVAEDLYLREFGREEDQSEQLAILSFRLGKETYGVRLTSIKQIIKLTPITKIPRAPRHVLGILSLRGMIIPVFDLRRQLHLPAEEPTRKSRIIVVSEGIYSVGLIVDEVEQVVRLPVASLEPPPTVLAGAEVEYIEAIGRSASKMIILLALEKILTPVAGAETGRKNGS